MELLEKIANMIWSNYLIGIFISVGIFYTITTNFIQIRGFKLAFQELKESLTSNKEQGIGTITPIQALCTALSSCVGNGNIVGVATAIASGGPGAVFWMWISGFLGMATKYGEIVLGIIFREKNTAGEYVGGPMYYISKGLGWKKISILFSALMFFQICGGALIQSNAVSIVGKNIFNLPSLVSGIFMAIIIFSVVVGGIKRLGKVSEKIIPIMTSIYIIGGVIIIFNNIELLPNVFITIIKSAFNFSALGGGLMGYSIKESMRFGLARGLYSNEAGEGSAPVLHSGAITTHPSSQGLFGIIEVFVDTIVICTLTSFIILCSGMLNTNISPALYVIKAFEQIHPFFKYVIGTSMILFAFSSVLAQWYFGNVTLSYIFNDKIAKKFVFGFICLSVIGATSKLEVVWLLQDIILGIMIIPNLIGIVLLNNHVKIATKEFFKLKNKERIYEC